jgi:hypothetical protein
MQINISIEFSKTLRRPLIEYVKAKIVMRHYYAYNLIQTLNTETYLIISRIYKYTNNASSMAKIYLKNPLD